MSDQPSTRARRRANSDEREPELAVVPARPEPAPARPRETEPAPAAREISLPGLVVTLRHGVWLFAATALACVLITAVALKLRDPVYTTVMVVAPAERDVGAVSRLASDLEQYASLATLAQTPTRFEQVSTIERYVEQIGSVPLAERLEREHQLLRRVFAGDWDDVREQWRPPPGVLAAARRQVLEFFGFPGWTPPTPAGLAEFLKSNVIVTRQGNSALRQLSFTHRDPEFAVSLLANVHAAADDLLRRETLDRVRAQSQRVEQEVADAPEERRATLEALLAEQYRAEALLMAELPFAAQVVRPPAAGAAPSSMSPFLVLALAAVVGVIAGIFVVFLRDALRSTPA